ncbi:hypothetical protein pb186bvf_013016 [Paramecium bursaria]
MNQENITQSIKSDDFSVIDVSDRKSRSNPISEQQQIPQLPVIQQSQDRSEYESQVQSLSESFPGSEYRALLKQREQLANQYVIPRLNAMVVGSSALGKSTFIDVILKHKFKMQQVIRQSTAEIQQIPGRIDFGNNVFVEINFIDTPGFKSQNSHKAWLKVITGFIKAQYTTYLNRRNKPDLDISQFRRIKAEQYDERVHVCFYFFSGPRLCQDDLYALKKLSHLVNIIPILAKGDSFTQEETIQIKNNFLEQIRNYGIQLYRGKINDQFPIIQSSFGQTPPYAIITSIEQFEHNGELIYGRKFAWGICNIFNPLHSDLIILYKQLIGHFYNDLIDITEYLQNQIEKRKVQKQESRLKNQSWLQKVLSSFF